MKNLNELVANQIYRLINYTLSKIVKPDISIEKVTDLDEKMISDLKIRYGIEGIILDVDDTLRRDMHKIPECNEKWIDNLKGQLKVIIVSNGIDRNIENFFKEKGIDYIGFAHKPLKKNFIKACEKLQIETDKVLVVGNSLFDDIYGGNRNDMLTVLVKNVDEDVR